MTVDKWSSALLIGICCAALLLASLASAVPAEAQGPPPPTREVIFVLDASRSVEPSEWSALTRGVAVAVQRQDLLPLGTTSVSAVVFSAPGPLGAETPQSQTVLDGRRLTETDDVIDVADIIRGQVQPEGATGVLQGLRGAAAAVSSPGAETETTVCLLTDGIENVEADTIGSVQFLADAGVDRFSVIAAEDPDASVDELVAEYSPLVFGGGVLTTTTNRGVVSSSVADGCFSPAIQVSGIEVNQGVQDLMNRARLVWRKPAIVRVAGHAPDGVAEWTGRLQVLDEDGDLVREYGPVDGGTTSLGSTATLQELREQALEFRVLANDLGDEDPTTFTFVPASGQVSCLDPGADCSVTLTPERFSRRVVFLGVDVFEQGPGENLPIAEARPAELSPVAAELAGWVRRGLPFELIGWEYVEADASYDATTYLTARRLNASAADDADAAGLVNDEADPDDEYDRFIQAREDAQNDAHRRLISDILAITVEQSWRLFADREDTVVYGLFDIPGIGGKSNGFDAATSAGAGFQSRLVHLHEIGHSLGLPHAATEERDSGGFEDDCGAVASSEQWPHTVEIDGRVVAALGEDLAGAGFWGHTGFGSGSSLTGVMPRSAIPNLMGYCSGAGQTPSQWIGGDQWNRIIEEDVDLRLESTESIGLVPDADGQFEFRDIRRRIVAVQPAAEPTHLVQVYRDGTPEPVQEIPADLLGEPGLPSIDDSGDVLIDRGAEPSLETAALGADIRTGSAYTLRLTDLATDEVVSSVDVSASAPRVEITSDLSDGVTGPFTLDWEGTDEDGDTLRYDVLVRNTGTWVPIALDLAESEYVVDPSDHFSSTNSLRLMVVASDGMRTGTGTSFVDFTAVEDPWITGVIVQPFDGDTFTYGETIELDSEILSNAAVPTTQFDSDVDGRLSSGRGSVLAADLSPGRHEITLTGAVGSGEDRIEVILDRVTIQVQPTTQPPPTDVTVQRTAGADRYQTAAAIADLQWPAGAEHVFIASGEDFPDALTAGPAAAVEGAPILLTPRTGLAPATRDALLRLQPSRVTVVGGTAVILQAVEQQISDLFDSVSVLRVAGPNRFATSVAVADRFLPEAERVYLATGRDFPDALAGGATAGWRGSPILLTETDVVPQELRAFLTAREPRAVEILGGDSAVGPEVEASLTDSSTDTVVTRHDGIDRFETAAAAMEPFGASSSALLATGRSFPDGLSVASAAAIAGVPVLLTEPDRLPDATAQALIDLGVTNVRLIGGTVAISEGVEAEVLGVLRGS